MFGSEFGAGLAPMLVVVGRALLGCLFVAGGLRHVTIFDAIAKDMAKRGVPLPRLALAAGTAFQIVAGTLLILGIFVVPAALGLIVFTIAATVMMLNFWNMEGETRVWCVNNWLSNIGIIGGLLLVAAQGLA
jgi:putative oxidoreductase